MTCLHTCNYLSKLSVEGMNQILPLSKSESETAKRPPVVQKAAAAEGTVSWEHLG